MANNSSSRVGLAAAAGMLLTILVTGYALAAVPVGPGPTGVPPSSGSSGPPMPDAAEPGSTPTEAPAPTGGGPGDGLSSSHRLAGAPDPREPSWYAPADFTRSLIYSGLLALVLASTGIALVGWRRRQW